MSEHSEVELRTKFIELYNNEIKQKLEPYENQRKDELPVHILTTTIIVCFLCTFILGSLFRTAYCVIFIIIGIIAFVLLNIWKGDYIDTEVKTTDGRVITKRASKRTHGDIEMILKRELMPKVLEIFGNFTWQKHITNRANAKSDFLKKLNIFPNCWLISFDDCFFGCESGVSMEILETRSNMFVSFLTLLFLYILCSCFIFPFITVTCILFGPVGFIILLILILCVFLSFVYFAIKIIRNGNFNGVVISFRIPKKFKGRTFLYENKKTNKNIKHKSKKGYQKVILEDVTFDKNYTTYSDDQVEARYLLTTGFIERFNNIKTAFKAEFIRAEFVYGELILVIGANKDLFKMGAVTEETTYLTFKELFDEFHSVIELARYLKLDQNLGL